MLKTYPRSNRMFFIDPLWFTLKIKYMAPEMQEHSTIKPDIFEADYNGT